MTVRVIPGSTASPDVGSARPAAKSPQRTRTPVLVTEQEVVFGTGAALSVPPATTRRGWQSATLIAAIRRTLNPLPEPRPHYPRREPNYFEAARMFREMRRL
jgi:hypothetical protein